jgi:putative heme-binding domain-containing protein
MIIRSSWTCGFSRVLCAAGILSCAFLSLAQTGDPAKGKALVESSGCLNCHRIEDKGLHTAPELTDIGSRRTPERLQASILTPDAEVLPENRYVQVVTKDGTTVKGRLLNQDGFSIQMIDTKDQLRSFLKSNLKEHTILDKGLMPSFEGKLKSQDVADIVAYLSALKGNNP